MRYTAKGPAEFDFNADTLSAKTPIAKKFATSGFIEGVD